MGSITNPYRRLVWKLDDFRDQGVGMWKILGSIRAENFLTAWLLYSEEVNDRKKNMLKLSTWL